MLLKNQQFFKKQSKNQQLLEKNPHVQTKVKVSPGAYLDDLEWGGGCKRVNLPTKIQILLVNV